MRVNVLPGELSEKYHSLLLPGIAEQIKADMPVTVLILSEGDIACGALAGYLKGSRFIISSLYVSPEFRHKGGGRLLLETLFEQLPEAVSGVEISYTETMEEHQTLQPFLEELDFEAEPNNGEAIYATTLGEILQSPFFANAGKKIGVPFSRIDTSVLFSASKEAEAANKPLPLGGLLTDTIDRNVSVAYIRNGRAENFITVDSSCEAGLMLLPLEADVSKLPLTIGMLRSLIYGMKERYSPDTVIITYSLNNVNEAMIQKLFPAARAISYTYYRSV